MRCVRGARRDYDAAECWASLLIPERWVWFAPARRSYGFVLLISKVADAIRSYGGSDAFFMVRGKFADAVCACNGDDAFLIIRRPCSLFYFDAAGLIAATSPGNTPACAHAGWRRVDGRIPRPCCPSCGLAWLWPVWRRSQRDGRR
jgi:hypothetical protein